MKKQIAGFILTVAFGFALATGALAQAGPGPIKIGGSLPLTGIYSETAKLIKEGYEFWAEDVNKRGGLLGRPVRLTIRDDESNTDKAITYYERAITVDNVDLVFGGYPATSNVALMPLMEKYQKVFVGMGGQLPAFEQGYTYSFGSPPLISDWPIIAFNGVVEDLIPKADRPKTLALVTMNNVIGLTTKPAVLKMAERNGIKVVMDEVYNLPLNDATPLVSKAKGMNADMFVCLSFFDDGVMLARAAKSMRYNPKLLFELIAATIPAWIKEMGQDGNNVITGTPWSFRLPFKYNELINGGAKERLKLPSAPIYFGFGFCWMKTLELGVQGAGTLDNSKIRDYLRTHKLDLPYGNAVSFDKRGLPSPFYFGLQTTNGQTELIWPKSIATATLVYPRPQWSR